MAGVNLALLGFGNVGRAFARYLRESGATGAELRIRAVADSTGGVLLDSPEQLTSILQHKELGSPLVRFSGAKVIEGGAGFVRSLASQGIRVLVESLPTNIESGEPALGLLESALKSGLSVVTVDKGPLVHGFHRLVPSGRTGMARVAYSGTTGVAIPEDLVSESVVEIRGVLNGTTNYILNSMQQPGANFARALADAVRDGIAEPDPRLDCEGWDAASKILILANALMNATAQLRDVSRTGIGAATESLIITGRESGRVVRLVGRARIWQGRVRVSVAPKLVGPDSPFYDLPSTSKRALFRTASGREVIVDARSGRDAISQTILEDVLKVIA